MLAAALVCGSFFPMYAVQAVTTPILKTLPDGTQIEVVLHGDEKFHYETLTDGTMVAQKSDGFYYYATANMDGIEAMPYRVGAALPSNVRMQSKQALGSVLSELQKKSEERWNQPMQKASRMEASMGEHGLVILVNFKDVEMKYDRQVYDDMLNKEGFTDYAHKGSARDYFVASSYGQFTPQFDVLGPYTLSQKQSYYGANGYSGDLRVPDMIVEACQLASADGHDLSKYDENNDGKIDNVYVFYAGEGEATGGDSNTIWPHRWIVMPGYNFSGNNVVNGVEIYDYATSNEIYTALESVVETDFSGVGTFIHEFSHVLGLPDLYVTNYGGHQDPDIYDVMSAGNYLYAGRVPMGYSAYERMFAGWLTPKQIFPSRDGDKMTLQPIEEGEVLLLTEEGQEHNLDGRNPSPATFYLIENRSGEGWDAYANYSASGRHYTVRGDKGLLITRVKYDAGRWENNEVNNYRNDMGVMYKYNTAQSNFYPMFPGKRAQTSLIFGEKDNYKIYDIVRDEETGAVSFSISDEFGENGNSSVKGLTEQDFYAIGGTGALEVFGDGATAVEVYTPSGAKVYAGNDRQVRLAAGLYIVKLQNAGKVSTQKIVVR